MSPPSRVGPYDLLQPLGRGGMAEVFEAVRADDPAALRVALKVVSTEGAPRARIQRFLDEARIGALLHHPNVVRTLDVGWDGHTAYLAMELLEGQTLSSILRSEGPLPVGWVAAVTQQLLEGLLHMHRARAPDGRALQLVHRDIKPSNLFLTRDGVAKLIDFGIALGDFDTTRTPEDTVRGTLAYASPEHLNGHPVDGRSDLFSLAVVIHELLTGVRLFGRQSDGATISAVLFSPALPVSTLRADVPPGLEALVQACLNKDPAQRPESAATVASLLEKAVGPADLWSPERLAQWSRQKVEAGPPKTAALQTATLSRAVAPVPVPVERSSEEGQAPRRRGLLPTAAAVAALALIAAAGWGWSTFEADVRPEASLPISRQPTIPAASEASAAPVPPPPTAPQPKQEQAAEVSQSPSPPPVRTSRSAPARPQRTRSAAKAVAETGYLTVDARPEWARVRMGGEDLGVTPLYRRRVPAGRHTLDLVREDGERRQRTVRVQPGQEAKVILQW